MKLPLNYKEFVDSNREKALLYELMELTKKYGKSKVKMKFSDGTIKKY